MQFFPPRRNLKQAIKGALTNIKTWDTEFIKAQHLIENEGDCLSYAILTFQTLTPRNSGRKSVVLP